MPKANSARCLLRGAALAALVLAFVQPAAADTRALYKWIDANGKQQYSDKPPTGFKGEVTRIDVELDTPPPHSAPPPAAKPPPIPPDVLRDVTPAPPDIAKSRRDKRERLEAEVRKAREKVAAAQAALDSGGDPKDDERQMVRRTYAQPQAGRSNCRETVDAAGKKAVNCPAMIPNEEYYERVRSLEEALRKAKDELAEAQAAYSRGVD